MSVVDTSFQNVVAIKFFWNKTMTRLRYLLLLCLFSGPLWAQTVQQAPPSQPRMYIGGYFGRSFVELDSRINPHNCFGFFWQPPSGRNFHWNLSFEYYDANGAWGKDLINYKGTTYSYQSVQFVKSVALNFYLSKSITRLSSAGFGLGVERISTEMTYNKAPFTFCIDQNDQVVICNPITETSSFFAPAALFITNVHHSLIRGLQIAVRTQIKLAYIGRRHHAHPLDSWISFAAYGGIRFGL